MSDPQRRRVRVRRSPKISVFLLIGAVAGALVAIVAVNVTPPDPTTPTIQTVAFLAALLAPVGALIAGAVALVLDRIAERRAKIVEAERLGPAHERGIGPKKVPEPVVGEPTAEQDIADRP